MSNSDLIQISSSATEFLDSACVLVSRAYSVKNRVECSGQAELCVASAGDSYYFFGT